MSPIVVDTQEKLALFALMMFLIGVAFAKVIGL